MLPKLSIDFHFLELIIQPIRIFLHCHSQIVFRGNKIIKIHTLQCVANDFITVNLFNSGTEHVRLHGPPDIVKGVLSAKVHENVLRSVVGSADTLNGKEISRCFRNNRENHRTSQR